MITNILEYFEKTAAAFPGNPAFADEETVLSFEEALTLSQTAGSALLKKGLSKEPVVVFLPKKPETICAFFGVIYAGCYYVPMDVGMPLHRIRMILKKLSPRAIVVDEESEKVARELGYEKELIQKESLFEQAIDREALQKVRREAIDIDPIYIVFTSGSTGVPKGVTGCHRALIDYAEAICPVIGASPESIFGMQVPLYVDACMKEILSVITCGSSVYLMPQALFMMPLKALEYMNRYRINTICWVASALTLISGLGAFEELKPEYLTNICFGSEVFPVKQLHLWQEACPKARFVNFYGPTECTGMSFYYEIDRPFEEGEPIPVGRPFPNTGFFLLKEDDTVAAPGETGEICIRGTCVTLGYYEDERTQQSFVQNPLQNKWPELIYKTGDLGYLNPEGNLVFASRKDSQIKNMGHRIELGEIEMCASSAPGVEACCCLFNPEKKKLSLFYMGSADSKELQLYLRKELPRYMVPTRLTQLERLPMLSNGKVDRGALKEMDA